MTNKVMCDKCLVNEIKRDEVGITFKGYNFHLMCWGEIENFEDFENE